MAENNSNDKVMGVLAYLSILVLIPILAAKDSKFARFHSNQGLWLLIVGVAGSIVLPIVSVILALIPILGLILVPLVDGAFGIFMLVLMIMGIVNVVKGEEKPLPIIGKLPVLLK